MTDPLLPQDDQVVAGTNLPQSGKYLTFQLEKTQFGIPILSVVELLTMMEITAVPLWPDFAKGTINLRGRVIPVVDLRQKFGLPGIEATEQTCTIVVELGDDQVGIEVEAVNEVQEINPNDISDAPKIGGTVDSDFILGMGKINENTIILLDLDNILVGEDMTALHGITETTVS
ncbi:MAG: purine-binding chemotaxis protein CheW [Proteobacteria bacterium]|nr:purine-binding chemotaxis protein CheW [Pseudomonadota bacterium]